MITECKLNETLIEENGVKLPYRRWEYEGRAERRAEVHAQIDTLCRQGWTAERLKIALLAGKDVLGILPLSDAERTLSYCCMHEVQDTRHLQLVKGLMARYEALRLSCRANAPAAPRLVHVTGERFANLELSTAFVTRADEEDDEDCLEEDYDLYDLAA